MFSSSRTAPEKPPCSKSCFSPLKKSWTFSQTFLVKSPMPPRFFLKATTKPAITAASRPTIRMAGSSVAMMPPMLMPSALKPIARSAMPALAVMTAPMSATIAPAATTKPAKAFFTPAGMARMNLRSALSASTTAVTTGLST